MVTDWAAVLASDFAVPANSQAGVGELVDELCGMLTSADPKIRDDTAYPVLAMWLARGVLDGRLAVLGDRMTATLRHEEIQARTFAAMILGWVVLRDARTGELSSDAVPGWYAGFAQWWLGESDLRGWDARLGWLHAVAHGADALRAFGRSPRLTVAGLRDLLDLAVDRLLAETDCLFAQDEDGRLGYALSTVLTRTELSEAVAIGWLDRVQAAFEAGEPGPAPAWASNTLRTLACLHLFADRGVRWYDPDTGALGPAKPIPHSTAVRERIATVLRRPWRGLG
jgi:Protein of unknown function (DUF2785)